MDKKIKILFLALTISYQANAFDKILCQTQMQEWIVTLTEDNRTAVLNPNKQSITLTAKQSETLIIKDTDNNIVASIFPWNGLYVRKGKNLHGKYSISFSESKIGFEVEVTEKNSKFVRRLSCRFTF